MLRIRLLAMVIPMADNLTPKQRKKNMHRIRSKDTSIEIKLRNALWQMGIRYRKNYRAICGVPDIVIIRCKIAIFCDSSFWHGKDYDTKKPVDTNHEYWDAKIRRNMARDKEVNQKLQEAGWTVLRFWDTEINKCLDECVERIQLEIKASDLR